MFLLFLFWGRFLPGAWEQHWYFCSPGTVSRRPRGGFPAPGWRMSGVLSHVFTTIDELVRSVFKAVYDKLPAGILICHTDGIFYRRAFWTGFFVLALLMPQISIEILYDKDTYVSGKTIWGVVRRICAYAPTFSEKDFLPKNAFSPEGDFLPKTLVVLYCVISINNCMRMGA